MDDLDAETSMECERMAMNKRIAEFKTQQSKDLKRFVAQQQQEYQQFCEATRACKGLPPLGLIEPKANNLQSMSLPTNGMFFMDDEHNLALEGLGILEDPTPAEDPSPDEDAEPNDLPEQQEAPQELEPVISMARSLPINVPMKASKSTRGYPSKLLVVEQGAPAEA